MDTKLVLGGHSIDTQLTFHWQLGWHSVYITVDSWSIRSQQILINANESCDPWLAIDGLLIKCWLSAHGRLIKGIISIKTIHWHSNTGAFSVKWSNLNCYHSLAVNSQRFQSGKLPPSVDSLQVRENDIAKSYKKVTISKK